MSFEFLKLAGKISLPNEGIDNRVFWLGAVGVRKDGTMVNSRNGVVRFTPPTQDFQYIYSSHAEGRVLQKMDVGGTLYVSRVARVDYRFAMARPCPHCQRLIRAKGIKKVFYTVNSEQYGIWQVEKDEDRIYNFKESYNFSSHCVH